MIGRLVSKSLGLALVGAALSLTLAACGGSDEKKAEGGSDTIVFSILTTENSQNQRELWAPFLADMEAQTGLEIEPFFGSNYASLVEAMRFNQVQVGWFSNASGLEAVRRADGEVFMRSTDPSGVDGYKSLIIVPASSRTTLDDVLKCDRSLTFGMGDAKSTSGTMAPMTYLFGPRGIDPARCFSAVRSANHEANLLAVANNQVGAATNNSTMLRLRQETNPDLIAKVRVVWESPTIPEDPLVWRKDLDPSAKEKLRSFFLTYGTAEGPEGERQREILRKLSWGTFRAADDTHLLPVREMEATEKLIEARNGGAAAAIAEAQRALDAVRAERARVEAATPAQAPADPVPAQK